jgi:phage terminase large subunit-like protein
MNRHSMHSGRSDCLGRWAKPSDRAIDFIERLTLTEDCAGQPFKLATWQKEIIQKLFDTLTPEGLRQYRTCLLFLPRKNAKSQLIAGIVIYWLLDMGKKDQQIVIGTSSVKQSRELFEKIVKIIEANPFLARMVEENKASRRLLARRPNNELVIITDKTDVGQGMNPSLAIIDELHTQTKDKLYKAMNTGRGARKEPLTVFLTTAGNNRQSLCYHEYEYACKVRDGLAIDPYYLPIIYEAPSGADIYDPEVWKACNPGIESGIKSLESIQAIANKARHVKQEELDLRHYELNMWVASEHSWMNMDIWYACGQRYVDSVEMRQFPCYAGFDTSESRDATAWVMLFDLGDGTYRVLCKFWIPENYALASDAKGFTQYAQWAEAGYITLMPGDYIDFDQVEADIIKLIDEYQFEKCYFDSWHARRTALKLMENGFPMESYDQTFKAMAEPTGYLQWLIANGRIEHGNNPVLAYMANNALADSDRAGNTKVTKGKEGDKVDGIVCLVMAVAAATLGVREPEPGITVLKPFTGEEIEARRSRTA